MKVLVYGADSFMGMHIIYRFYKDGYRVVGVYSGSRPDYVQSAPHAKYVLTKKEKISDIIRTERPDLVVYAKTKTVITEEKSKEKIIEFKNLVEACVSYKINKLIYLSSINVYEKGKTDENMPTKPATIDAKAHVVCEQILTSFRADGNFKDVILRVCDIYGKYKELSENDQIFNLIKSIKNDEPLKVNFNKTIALIHPADVADAIVRSVGDYVFGIYNITPKAATTYGEIVKWISSYYDKKYTVPADQKEDNYNLPSHKRAVLDFEFICREKPKHIIEETIEWFEETAVKKKKAQKKQQSRLSLRTLENFIVFLILACITFFGGGSSNALTVNLMIIYIVLIAAFFGINQGVLSAILVSIYNVFYMTTQGYSITAALYSANVLVEIVKNLLLAISIGYIVERRDYIITEKEAEIESLTSDVNYLTQINYDLTLIKNEQEEKVLKYENGLGSIYAAFAKLNTLSPKEVFFNSLLVIKEMIDENDISLYIVQSESGYMRRLVYVGKISDKFPKTFKIPDNELLHEIVKNKSFFSNNYLNESMPSVIMPIVANNRTIALIMIDNMAFERLTLYYMNTLQIISKLLSDTYTKAINYENLEKGMYFEHDTCIIEKEKFKEILKAASAASTSSGLVYSLLEIIPDTENLMDFSNKIKGLIRDNDELGRLENGNLGIILYSTSETESKFVIERLSANNIKAEIIPL